MIFSHFCLDLCEVYTNTIVVFLFRFGGCGCDARVCGDGERDRGGVQSHCGPAPSST